MQNTCEHRHTKTEYLAYVFSDETSHHHAICVNEKVCLGLRGSAQSNLLETQFIVRNTPHIFSLKPNKQKTGVWNKTSIHKLNDMNKQMFCDCVLMVGFLCQCIVYIKKSLAFVLCPHFLTLNKVLDFSLYQFDSFIKLLFWFLPYA